MIGVSVIIAVLIFLVSKIHNHTVRIESQGIYNPKGSLRLAVAGFILSLIVNNIGVVLYDTSALLAIWWYINIVFSLIVLFDVWDSDLKYGLKWISSVALFTGIILLGIYLAWKGI